MRRGYLRGLIIGGILGVAIGQILKSRENNKKVLLNQQDNSLKDSFIEKDLDAINFNEDKYNYYFKEYNEDEEEQIQETQWKKLEDKEEGDNRRLIGRRKKPTRLTITKHKRRGSLEK
ncbi:hypothetical protein SAMN02745227_00473 [Anaerobranca californiensis DSM 14826]|uniref:Uncharacterized protein n=1 Tax=Anaerobranca californiensis DSM 14826 TaxID=1120989 RepID=A0A1M6LDR2_9FIRM|nr:hypothetical protein [Anaerobranca californiensis]SHJ69308.1 hypothetical protein SAMN02745227_00473 [Anaerobranca californiensis DSM 14826]